MGARESSQKAAVVGTVISGHRGGGGDLGIREALTAGTDWSGLGRAPNHYDYREGWANRTRTFARMFREGVRSFELDLVLSRDGDPIVTHDSTVDGKVAWEWSTRELQSKGWATFTEVLDTLEQEAAAAGHGATVLVELKGAFSSEEGTDVGQAGVTKVSDALSRKVAALLSARLDSGRWTPEQLPVIGFNHAMLRLAREVEPRLLIGLSYASESFDLSGEAMATVTSRPDFETAIAGKMVRDAVEQRAFAINPDVRFVDERLLRAAKNAGILVQAWIPYGVEEPTRTLLQWGVDVLITDCPLAAEAEKRRLARGA